jgi:hypothetical protein
VKEFAYNEIEIGGFNGGATGVCGRAVPIAYVIETGQFFRLIDGDGVALAKTLYSSDDIEEWRDHGNLTMLPKNVPAFAKATVIYVKKELLDTFGCEQPQDQFNGLQWQKLQGINIQDDTWAACDFLEETERLMNDWGRSLMDKATHSLIEFYKVGEESLAREAEHLADLALFAARHKDLRASIYLRYGAALVCLKKFEGFINVYKGSISHEFPGWDWKTLEMQLGHFTSLMRIHSGVLDEGFGQTFEDEIYRKVNRISQIQDKPKRRKEAQEAAVLYSTLYPVERKYADRLHNKIKQSSEVRLDEQDLRVLATEPAFYLDLCLENKEEGPLFKGGRFWMAADEMHRENIDPGYVASLLLNRNARPSGALS